MIGRPVQPINHVCLADDYNKLVEVIRPYQNLTIGQGLIGNFSNTGISISVAKQPNASFKHPFKVTQQDATTLNIQFGRVFREDNSSEPHIITELSFVSGSGTTFDVLSGMNLSLSANISDSIAIGIDYSGTDFFINTKTKLDTDSTRYYVHPICNFVSTSSDIDIEQIQVGDYTYTETAGGGSSSELITVNEPLTGDSLSAEFNYPFRVVSNRDLGGTVGGVSVLVGRVYEYGAFDSIDGTPSDKKLPIMEKFNNGSNPGEWEDNIATTSTECYICVVGEVEYNRGKFDILNETYALANGYYVIRRIAKVYKSDAATITSIEQIHMGDVAFTDPNIKPFQVAGYGEYGYTDIMYIPDKSLMINGQDYTGNAIANSTGALQSTSLTNWYGLKSTDFYNIYIRLNDDASSYGTVNQTYFQTSNPGVGGELITVPLFDPSLRRSYQAGTCYKEFIRTDAHALQYTGMRKSLDESVNNAQASGDRTMQVANFKYADANSDPLDGTGTTYEYTILVREYDSANNNAEIKYAPWDAFSEPLTASVENYIENNFYEYLQDYWWDWYDELSGTTLSGRGFWETGGDKSTNYGSSIGDSNAVKVIDLDTRTLETSTWNYNTLAGDNLEANNVTTTTLSLSSYQLYLHPDGTVRWQ